MINELEKNNFLIIRNFISEERSKKLSKEFKKYCKNNNVSDDTQVPNTPSQYDYISFLELLCEKTPEVSRIIGETVLPTYSYARIYKNSDVLSKHTDRDSCEVSLTIHLNGDKPWKIYVETTLKEEVGITLNPGDALLYLGCAAAHWREPYEGEFYSQVFLHYVRSRGSRNKSYFDKSNSFLSNVSLGNNKGDKIDNLDSYIHIIEDIIPIDLCDRIISEYGNSNCWDDSCIVGSNKSERIINKKIRNCEIINLSVSEIIEKNKSIRKKLDEELYSVVSKIFSDVFEKYSPHIIIKEDSGYDLLRYNKGGFYTQHTDNCLEIPREISCSLCLNDDYEGGEFGFFNRKLKLKPKKGSAVVFPSNFMFPHEIMKVKEGTRYSIITWFK